METKTGVPTARPYYDFIISATRCKVNHNFIFCTRKSVRQDGFLSCKRRYAEGWAHVRRGNPAGRFTRRGKFKSGIGRDYCPCSIVCALTEFIPCDKDIRLAIIIRPGQRLSIDFSSFEYAAAEFYGFSRRTKINSHSRSTQRTAMDDHFRATVPLIITIPIAAIKIIILNRKSRGLIRSCILQYDCGV